MSDQREYAEKVAYSNTAQLGRLDTSPYKSPTLSENIENRINQLQNQINQLTRVKLLLAEPAGILNVPIDDLRFAMNY